MEEWRYSSTIVDLGSGKSRVVSFVPSAPYLRGNFPMFLLDMRLGGPQSRSRHRGEEKHLSYVGTLSPTLNSVAVVRKRTIPTERLPLVGEINANLCW
jgi:hypothetical protein